MKLNVKQELEVRRKKKIGERNLKKKDRRKLEKEICGFFLNKEKEKVMKTKEELCQKRLFRNLLEGPAIRTAIVTKEKCEPTGSEFVSIRV